MDDLRHYSIKEREWDDGTYEAFEKFHRKRVKKFFSFFLIGWLF